MPHCMRSTQLGVCVNSPFGWDVVKDTTGTQESRFYPRKAFPEVRDRVFDIVTFAQEVSGYEDIK